MSNVHWLGAGLSSLPGIHRLAKNNSISLILWNRTLANAEAAVAELDNPPELRTLDWEQLEEVLAAGDILVSMLPATMHVQAAELCLDKGAHFISSSYISPEMAALDDRAKAAGLCLVNEVGLDPGLDHMLAHQLIADYKASDSFDPNHSHSFRSYCGGFPVEGGDFRYKFSWSPLGVIRALNSPAQWIENGETQNVDSPYTVVKPYSVDLGGKSETFEAYPNRDSVPFVAQYALDQGINIEEFVRGTLRLQGWEHAWQSIFNTLETTAEENKEQVLRELSDQLWRDYQYEEHEADRVVLVVELEVKQGDTIVWSASKTIDARGNRQGSAMARLVSIPVSQAVLDVASDKTAPGVHAAPDDEASIGEWMDVLIGFGDEVLSHSKTE